MRRKRPFVRCERRWIPGRLRAKILLRQEGRCADCGTRLILGFFVFDHRPPLALRDQDADGLCATVVPIVYGQFNLGNQRSLALAPPSALNVEAPLPTLPGKRRELRRAVVLAHRTAEGPLEYAPSRGGQPFPAAPHQGAEHQHQP